MILNKIYGSVYFKNNKNRISIKCHLNKKKFSQFYLFNITLINIVMHLYATNTLLVKKKKKQFNIIKCYLNVGKTKKKPCCALRGYKQTSVFL